MTDTARARMRRTVQSVVQRVELRVAIAVSVALLVVDRRMLAGDAVWGRDLPFWVVPSRVLLRDALTRGELPRWDHAQAVGAPVLVNPLHGVFYPPTLLSLLSPVPWWTTLFLWLHALLGALGASALARLLGCSAPARVTAALAWTLSGPMLSEWTAGLRIPSLAWAPWIAVGAATLARSPSARAVPALAIPVGLALLAGEPFVASLAVLFSLLSLPASEAWERARADRPYALRVAAFGGVALGVGAMLAAASVAPMLAGAAGTQRVGAFDLRQALHWSVHPARMLDLLVPGGLRRASEFTQHPWALARCDIDPLFFSHYLGATTLALALVGVRRERRALTLLGLGALALLLAFGRHTPVYAVARALVPPLRIMRSPEKLVTVVALATALLAALGVDRIAKEPKRALRALPIPLALIALIALGDSVLPAPVARVIAHGAGLTLWPLGLLTAGALLARKRADLAPWALALAVFLDLSARGSWLHPWYGPDAWAWRPPLADALAREFGPLRAPGVPRLLRAQTIARYAERMTEFAPGDRRFYATLPPNLSATFGVGVMPPYDVAVAPALESFLGSRRVEVARLLSVDATVQPSRPTVPAGLRRVGAVGTGVDLLAFTDSLPRVYPVGRATPRSDADARGASLDDAVLAGREAVLSVDAPALTGSPSRTGSCELRTARGGELAADCALSAESAVVFVEQHSPGWRASVDGRETPVQRANLLVMAVRAPAGRHRVALRYTPPGLTLGLVGSALGMIVVAALWSRGRRASKDPAGA